MQEVGQLEDLGRDGGQTVAVEPENLQAARQVGEAAALQRRDAVVVQEPAGGSGQGWKHVEIRGEDRDYAGEWRHSQVLERQSGEGAGLDLHDVVVAEVERFQGDEGPELLRRDPGDPVVCSENTDTVAPINDKNTACLTSGTHPVSRFLVHKHSSPSISPWH